jgi:quercetin dioxygenase-like cupin family protein
MKIEKSGSKPTRRGPIEWFTGTVWVDEIAPPDEPSRVHVLRVFFEPGARTAWHTHPFGQVLHVLSGVARVQKSGEAAVDAHPGDTVWIAPGERHWHGAAPGHAMAHLAVQRATAEGNEVTWMEQVSAADYGSPPA